MERATSKRQILTYLVLVFLFSSVFYFLILHAGNLRGGSGLYVRGLMWCPALAEFGAVLPLVVIGFAIYYWRRWRELPTSDEANVPATAVDSAGAVVSA
jgi:hypothetical protein